MPQIQNTLPTFFSQVAKQLYDAMQEQQEQGQQQNSNKRHSMEQSQEQQYRLDQLVGDYQQYKQLMKRVYVYIVKETLKLNQEAPRRLANTPELVRKVCCCFCFYVFKFENLVFKTNLKRYETNLKFIFFLNPRSGKKSNVKN